MLLVTEARSSLETGDSTTRVWPTVPHMVSSETVPALLQGAFCYNTENFTEEKDMGWAPDRDARPLPLLSLMHPQAQLSQEDVVDTGAVREMENNINHNSSVGVAS